MANYGGAAAAPSGDDSFLNQYGEPSASLQNVGNKASSYEPNPAYNGANSMGDVIPIDTSIQHYELPNLTQRKLYLAL